MKTARLVVTILFVALLLSVPAQATSAVVDGAMAAEPTAPTIEPATVSESYNPDGLDNLPESDNPYEPAHIYSPRLNLIVERMFLAGVALVVFAVVGFAAMAIYDRYPRRRRSGSSDKPDPNHRG